MCPFWTLKCWNRLHSQYIRPPDVSSRFPSEALLSTIFIVYDRRAYAPNSDIQLDALVLLFFPHILMCP